MAINIAFNVNAKFVTYVLGNPSAQFISLPNIKTPRTSVVFWKVSRSLYGNNGAFMVADRSGALTTNNAKVALTSGDLEITGVLRFQPVSTGGYRPVYSGGTVETALPALLETLVKMFMKSGNKIVIGYQGETPVDQIMYRVAADLTAEGYFRKSTSAGSVFSYTT